MKELEALEKGRKIGIVGCGFEAVKLIYHLQMQNIHVDYVFDNYKTGDFFGLPIIPLKDVIRMGEIFLLISTEKYYDDIREQLLAYGLNEFSDFIKGGAFNKGIAIIYGNCYAPVIAKMLRSNDEFEKKYYVYDSTPLYIQDVSRICNIANIVKHADLFLHQDIRKENKIDEKFSIDNMRKFVKKGGLDITFPNLVGMGSIFFQRCELNNDNNPMTGMPNGIFPYMDSTIDKMVSQNMSIQEIVKAICYKGVFDRQSIHRHFEEVVNKFRNREKQWDVKCIEYIMENYKERRIFYDLVHPTGEIMRYIAEGILSVLGIPGGVLDVGGEMSGYQMPIYPEVASALGLKYGGCDEIIRQNSICKLKAEMNLEEYIKEYVVWCYERRGIVDEHRL